MTFEVEMKAWVDDLPATVAGIERLCVIERAFDKRDVYYRAQPRGDGCPGAEFRLRRDGGLCFCGFKRKRLDGSLEINEEREFSVGDYDVARELFCSLGCEFLLDKRKRGTRYRYGEYVVELCRVDRLGVFIEAERIIAADRMDGGAISKTRSAIMGILHSVGIDDARIERRPYRAMLLERADASQNGGGLSKRPFATKTG